MSTPTCIGVGILLGITIWGFNNLFRLIIAPLLVLGLISSTLAAAEDDRGYAQQRIFSSDPSALTTQALQREIASLKEIITTRMDAADKAILLMQSKIDKEPQIGVVASQLGGLREVTIEKFNGINIEFLGIQRQFAEKDVQVKQTALLVQTAVDAALKAQQETAEKQNAAAAEASKKTETQFTKLIDQLVDQFRNGTTTTNLQISTVGKGLEEKITGLDKVLNEKNTSLDVRLQRVESMAAGIALSKTDQGASIMMVLAALGGLFGAVGMVVMLVGMFKNKNNGNGHGNGHGNGNGNR